MKIKVKLLKHIKTIFLLLMSTQLVDLYANKLKEKALREVEVSNVLLEEPSFKLKIRKSGAPLVVHLNGVQVFKELSTDQTSLYYPVNDFIANGENIINFDLISDENMGYRLGKDTYASVSLLLEITGGEDQIISTLSYDNRQKDKLSGSSVAGKYSSLENFKASNNGNVKVSKIIEKQIASYNRIKIEGISLEHIVSLRTSFPRWKFLDSDFIMEEGFDYNALSDKEYQELKETPLIQSLYDEYVTIHSALKRKDIEAIIDLFDERNEELDIALGLEKGDAKKNLYDDLKESSDNHKLIPFTVSKRSFFIEKGNRIAYVSPIAFDRADGITSKYNMKFRLKNGKWILTR
jgi:hypothetical protein